LSFQQIDWINWTYSKVSRLNFLISYLKHCLNHTRFGESYSILILLKEQRIQIGIYAVKDVESNSHTIKCMVYINLQSHVTLISFLQKHKDSMIEVICAHETRFTISWEMSVSYLLFSRHIYIHIKCVYMGKKREI